MDINIIIRSFGQFMPYVFILMVFGLLVDMVCRAFTGRGL